MWTKSSLLLPLLLLMQPLLLLLLLVVATPAQGQCGSDAHVVACDLSTHHCETDSASHEPVCVDDCASNDCLLYSTCVSDKKECFTTPCPQYRCECPDVCEDLVEPVCASNGVTYSNACELYKAKCTSGADFTLIGQEDCAVYCASNDCGAYETCVPDPKECFTTPCPQYSCQCADVCPDSYAPVCGSDGITYSNECAFAQHKCQSHLTDLTIVKSAECSVPETPDCGDLCADLWDPYCGSNGVTYPNLCELNRAGCVAGVSISGVQGACVDCTVNCIEEWNPVCGSDGATYSNACELERYECLNGKDISVAHVGVCDTTAPNCDNQCTKDYRPVCASNGKTFANSCMMEAFACEHGIDLFVASDGECASGCNAICPAIYGPVCGSDGITYANECELEANACLTKRPTLVAASSGACDSQCDYVCVDSVDPVCGTDGNTYNNECELYRFACLAKSSLAVASRGACDECSLACIDSYAPVCAMNGRTYSNECLLLAESCLAKVDIAVAFEGECNNCDDMQCTQDYKPVCVKGITFANLCELHRAECETGLTLTVDFEGSCSDETNGGDDDNDDCACQCPTVYSPVCGSDNVTYSNECLLGAAACLAKKTITIVNYGQCQPTSGDQCGCFCTEEVKPVCASNGITYMNPCLLSVAACNLPDDKIKSIHSGACISLPSWKDALQFDTDGDEKLSLAEFVAMVKSVDPSYEEADATAFFQEADTNGDGEIDEDEYNSLYDQQQCDSTDGSTTKKPLIIALSVVGGIALIAIAAAVAVYAYRKHRNGNFRTLLDNGSDDVVYDGDDRASVTSVTQIGKE